MADASVSTTIPINGSTTGATATSPTGNPADFSLDVSPNITSTDLSSATTNPITNQDLQNAVTTMNANNSPSQTENDLNTKLTNLRSQEDAAQLNLQKFENALPSEGISAPAISGRDIAMSRSTNLDLQTMASQEKNLMTQLGIAQTDRANTVKNAQTTLDNYDKMQTIIDKQKSDLATSANNLTTQARNALSSILSNFKGLSFDSLDPNTQNQLQDLASQTGIPIGVLQSGMNTNAAAEQLKTLQASNPLTGGGNTTNLPQVYMTATGLPDKTAQAQFLAQLPTDLATTVKAIANYEQNPSSIPTRQYKGVGGLTQQQVLSLVKQYDPTYNQTQYASRQATLTNFSSGKYSQNINSLNTAIGHLTDLVGNFASLGNQGVTLFNWLKNNTEQAFGAGGVQKASVNISAVVGELASTFKSAGATDSEIKSLGKIDVNSSPEQVKAYIETASQLLSSRLDALNSTYQNGMGKPKDGGFLSDTNQQSLLNLKAQGFDIKVPELADSPLVKIQNFHDASADNAKIIDGVKKIYPNASANDVINLLAQNGISL